MTSSVSKPSSLSTSFCRRLVSFSASLTRFSAYNDNVPLNNGFTSHVGRRVKLKFATVETRWRRVKIVSRSRSNSSSIKLPPRCHFQSTSRRSLGKKHALTATSRESTASDCCASLDLQRRCSVMQPVLCSSWQHPVCENPQTACQDDVGPAQQQAVARYARARPSEVGNSHFNDF